MNGNINRGLSPVAIRLAVALLISLVVATASELLWQTKAQAAEVCKSWAGLTSLQETVDANMCTEVQPGTYMLSKYLLIADGRILQGNPAFPRESIVIKAQAPFNTNGNEGLINGFQPPHTGVATIRHLTLDGNNLSTGAIGAGYMVIEDIIAQGGRCWGIAVVGPQMSVSKSLIQLNGADPTCPGAPGAGVYMSTNGTDYGNYGPDFRNNEIRNNTGPGVDIFNVWNGKFIGNNVHDNTGWAGFSLLGAYWTVDKNTISHPSNLPGQVLQAFCNGGPKGSHSSAIILCQGTVAGGVKTANNLITNNTLSSYYGILSIGNDEANALAVPTKNSYSGNIFPTATLQCADDYRRNGPNASTWLGCKPVYF